MADRPIKTPLPADLPEDWTSGQIVAPAGADVGLSEQHGYNYLMAAVNAAQRAANAINESFDNISGKRVCRVTVGASAAGWTKADCDYLCDGVDDQEELSAAVDEIQAAGGGEIAILGGEYRLSAAWEIETPRGNDMNLSFVGEPGATVLSLTDGVSITPNSTTTMRFSGLTFSGGEAVQYIAAQNASLSFAQCRFLDVGVSSVVTVQGAFAFRRNEVTISKALNSNDSVIYAQAGDKASCLIDGNTFWVSAYLGGLSSVITANGAIITENTIKSESAQRNIAVSANVGACVIGNAVSGANVKGDRYNCVGNRIENGSITASFESVVDGNIVNGGNIVILGQPLVTGNVVSAPSDTEAIKVNKVISPSIPANATPNISGNTITSGGIGISLDDNEDRPLDPPPIKALVSANRITGCATSIQIGKTWSECLVTGNMLDGPVVDGGRGNMVRLNSDDAGSGGGGTAGVSSFNGRSGAVLPLSGDYTAAMVGARPDTWTPTAADVGAIQSGAVVAIQKYDALDAKDASTLYLIKE